MNTQAYFIAIVCMSTKNSMRQIWYTYFKEKMLWCELTASYSHCLFQGFNRVWSERVKTIRVLLKICLFNLYML